MALTKYGPIFSLSSVYVKKPTVSTGGRNNDGTARTDGWYRIPGIHNANYKGSVTEVELTGDNAYLGLLRHTQKGVITVKAEYAAMSILELVSGSALATTSGAYVDPTYGSTNSLETLPFGALTELNPTVLSVKANMPINRTDGTTGTLTTYWYKTQVSTAFESFPGGAYGAITEMSLTFACFSSTYDEKNVALDGTGGRGPTTGCFGRVEFYDGILV